MPYEVLARKWRPQQFDEVVGQDHVTQTLKNAITSGRVAHAYLFVGPRGTGKTSTARILAKALNCAKGPTVTPCDQCDSCREIMAGSSLDVMEFDAASNTQVDRVRDIILDSIGFRPSRDRNKIFIIDEVHMLSNSSFNALLKTLEEPPGHVKFIFATTDPQKMPATVLSRCQRFDLRRISARDIVKRLVEIARDEKVEIDEDALLAIARGAEGGLRDAESTLDQLISFRGRKIAEADVLAVFGLVARRTLDALAEAVLRGDTAQILRTVAELDNHGKDIQRLVVELIEHFRDLLVFLCAGDDLAGLDIAEGKAEILRRQATLTDAARVLRAVEILQEADSRLRYALSRRTLLEVALIRASRNAVAVSINQILAHLNALKGQAAGQDAQPLPPAPSPSLDRPAARPADPAPAPPAAAAAREAPIPYAAPGTPVDSLALLSSRWHEILDRVGENVALAKPYLLDAKPVRIVGNHVTIGFDPEFAANKEKIHAVPRGERAVQRAMGHILNREVTVEFIVLDAKSTLPGDFKLDSATGKPARPASPTDAQGEAKITRSRQEWMKNPAVQKTLEMFSGGVIDIRE